MSEAVNLPNLSPLSRAHEAQKPTEPAKVAKPQAAAASMPPASLPPMAPGLMPTQIQQTTASNISTPSSTFNLNLPQGKEYTHQALEALLIDVEKSITWLQPTARAIKKKLDLLLEKLSTNEPTHKLMNDISQDIASTKFPDDSKSLRAFARVNEFMGNVAKESGFKLQ